MWQLFKKVNPGRTSLFGYSKITYLGRAKYYEVKLRDLLHIWMRPRYRQGNRKFLNRQVYGDGNTGGKAMKFTTPNIQPSMVSGAAKQLRRQHKDLHSSRPTTDKGGLSQEIVQKLQDLETKLT